MIRLTHGEGGKSRVALVRFPNLDYAVQDVAHFAIAALGSSPMSLDGRIRSMKVG